MGEAYIRRKIDKQINSKRKFIRKVSRRSKVSVLINHHQDLEKMLSSLLR